ncbi:MAG TPA: DEAD/DEAH box helicase family protein [Candidatus Ozemobacteraceae bacterium]|nr:DEAD/DEAH box helicase family protein [Candidatus Ozemobacteraceae bacterium]
MTTLLKLFQQTAVDNAVALLETARRQLSQVDDSASRQRIVSHNGCLLIEAPTGAGKTLIAGHTAETFSLGKKVVWFWFAPFAGLVEQSIRTIRNEFPGLTVKDLRNERTVAGVKSGDIFVTTWGSVAANTAESRKARTNSDTALSLDRLVPALKGLGYQLGVIVDEAHHGFKKAPEAISFYMNVLAPEYTVMVTATPKDKDIETFKQATGFEEIHKISISRWDCVIADLIKTGVKAVAFLVEGDAREITDFEKTAIRHGLEQHLAIERALEMIGIGLKPLMLVQIDSATNALSADETKRKLVELGIKPEQIAIHTADDPDPDLLALASDENVRVLIFKVAVALGFDCPRAFTLVSMRRSRDADFGIQVVGRILRVHRLLQGKTRPDILDYGYVFLTDHAIQEGLTQAAVRLKSIETQLTNASPSLTLVGIGSDGLHAQVAKEGQPSFWVTEQPKPPESPVENAQPPENVEGLSQGDEIPNQPRLFPGTPRTMPSRIVVRPATPVVSGATYPLRTDMAFPKSLKKEVCSADMVGGLAACIASRMNLDGEILSVVHRRFSQATKRTTELFGGLVDTETVTADISMKEIARKAQGFLFEDENVSGRPLHDLLIRRLKEEFQRQGWAEKISPRDLEDALNLILATHPGALREAKRRCYANFIEAVPAAPLPPFVSADAPLLPARLNVYGVFPDGLTTDEREFALLLDSDTSGTVAWWHRNPQSKPYTASLVMPELKYDFHPDFVVGVRERSTEDSVLLVEVKGNQLLNMFESVVKARAVHKLYKRVMMVHWEGGRQWRTVINDDNGEHNLLDQAFRFGLLPTY